MFRFNRANSGNLAREFAAPLPHTNTPPTRNMTYDDDNRLLTVNGNSVVNDLDGNLTSGPLTNGIFASYAYDARNRLQNVGGVTNTYDPAGNKIGITYGTNSVSYVINPNAKLPQVLMRIKNGVTNYYVYGKSLLYQVTETATATNMLTYHYDYRGSTVALSDNNGNVTDRIEYSLYGLMTYRVGTNDTPFLFNGKYGVMTDPNGLLYMRARYYNPYLCRFVSADPSGFSGGLNVYAYANGNPVSYLDPFGLGAVGESALSSSWMPTAPTAFEQQMQSFLTDFVNFVTLGTANDASTAFTGYDLSGNRATSQEQGVAAVMLGLAFIPGEDVEAAGSRVATELGDAVASTSGRFSSVFENAPAGFSNFTLGQATHSSFEDALNALYGTQQGDWRMLTAPGETGVDARFVGPASRYPGFTYAELKPYSQSGIDTFGDQLENWQLTPGQTQLFFYNRNGIIGSSGFNF